ncbi:MAG: glycosyltransferase family 4 protein [Desulfuromonadaceae bacterium]|nr:glycosyltransferase family 4 protein [Desulfuromonadaceae bacterium]MDD5106910.1 glycosyltransferase family 4 protein [Desulfuromonadaceae bacterium]
MKVLYLNGADIEGGAARAATRLLTGVHALGVDARLSVQRKSGDNPQIDGPPSLIGKAFGRARPTIEQIICGITPGKVSGPFCAAYLPDRLSELVADTTPDIVHLHWVARMMRLETLQNFKLPIVWTMHDSWPFTGGCYLPGDCTRYRESCGKCPLLNSSKEDDLSRRIWQRKMKAWHGLNLTFVAPSHWMAMCARSSSLLRNARVELIPNAIDVACFHPQDKLAAREALSLPTDKRLVLFGAKNFIKDRNKGFHLLAEAMTQQANSNWRNRIELVTFGSTVPSPPQAIELKVHNLGYQGDEKMLARLYSAADVFALPSLNESLGYTVMEAMACGTPAVAFNQGGVPDLIDHRHNGYLARPYETADLARGIIWVLENEDRRQELSSKARQKVEREFATDRVAEQHTALYRKILT